MDFPAISNGISCNGQKCPQCRRLRPLCEATAFFSPSPFLNALLGEKDRSCSYFDFLLRWRCCCTCADKDNTRRCYCVFGHNCSKSFWPDDCVEGKVRMSSEWGHFFEVSIFFIFCFIFLSRTFPSQQGFNLEAKIWLEVRWKLGFDILWSGLGLEFGWTKEWKMWMEVTVSTHKDRETNVSLSLSFLSSAVPTGLSQDWGFLKTAISRLKFWCTRQSYFSSYCVSQKPGQLLVGTINNASENPPV